jgi:4-amino-4-deoxy-L-arabinose transferase-like glycosyltransferase
MVAIWIWIGTHIAGDGALGVRFLAPISASIGSLLLAQAGEDLFPGRHAGRTAAVLLNATLLFGVGAVTMTPDTPLLFFWTTCLWAMARLQRTGQARWWLVSGLAVGLALDSKYTAVFLPIGIGLWCLLLPGPRRWVSKPMPWVAALLAALAFVPVVLWNATHGWASFSKQGGRSFAWHPVQALRYIAELLGGQAGLATPLVFILCLAAIGVCAKRVWQTRPAAEGLVAALTLPPIILFLQHALGDRVQANWPAILYPAAVIGVATLSVRWQRLVTPAALFGGILTSIVYIQGVWHPVSFGGKADPTARLQGWYDFSEQIDEIATSHGATFVGADNYGTASLLARSTIAVPVIGAEPRWHFFRLPDAQGSTREHRGLLITPADRHPASEGWRIVTSLERISRRGGGQLYQLYLVSGVPEGVILPRL